MLRRTQDEILNKMKEVEENDFFGTQREDLAMYLTYENAKKLNLLNDNATEESWNSPGVNNDPVEELKDYMGFAWDKANNFRGLSAARSMDHMRTWLWLDGQDEFLKEHGNLGDWEYYGKDILVDICKLYGIDHTKYDDGVRRNEE